ncbi:unnamed protein product [Ectocarpus sp. 4 AP-2014]
METGEAGGRSLSFGSGMPPHQRSSQLLGYVYSSPLVSRGEDGRRERMDQLGTSEELKMIRMKLGESGRQIRFRSEVAKPSNFRELLNSGCRMLHYTGHGHNEFLAFESNDDRMCGIMEPLHVGPLKNLFQAGGVQTELVFISSCSSEASGNAFVEAGVPHVVAVKREESVTDQAAQQFAKQFYDALLSEAGRFTVKQAFDIALNTVNAHPPNARPQGDHFLLLPHGGNHDVRIFDTLPEGRFVDETREPPARPRCARPVPFYQGLEELQKVVEMLVDPGTVCVTVTGEHGSGKTERAIQACDYVRVRHHCDAVLWADMKHAVARAVNSSTWGYDDPCRLIGIAIGMTQPGPNSEEELVRFLFDRPTVQGGRTCQKVLLVLEDVDSLFEAGGDARDRVLKLLSNLCSKGEHLKLLVTSEQSLQRDTNERFRHGTERVAKVKPLKDRDAAQLLMNKVPTSFKKKELGLSLSHRCTREDILKALEAHPVLKAAEGHPGTLLRLAPLLEDHNVNDACVLERATQHRLEYKQEAHTLRRHRASSNTSLASSAGAAGTGMGGGGGALPSGASDMSLGNSMGGGRPVSPTQPHLLGHAISHDTHFQQQQQQQHNGNGNGASPFFQEFASWTGGGEMHHPLLNGAGMAGGSSIHSSGIGGSGHGTHSAAAAAAVRPSSYPHHHRRRHSSHPQSPTHPQQHRPQRRMTVNQLMAQVELEEPDPPQMTPEEKRAWDTARTAGLMDRGCRLVWVKATTNAVLAGWTYDGGGGSDNGGFGWPAEGAGAGGVTNYDCVPWDYLRRGLMQHLCGKLTIPSNDREVVDEGPYGWRGDASVGVAGGGGEGNGYGAVKTPQVRGMNEEELAFVRGVLKAKQEKVRLKQEKLRQQLASRGYAGTELVSIGSSGAADAASGRGGGNGNGNGNVISLEAFVEFSLWWAPLMTTLSLLRDDWASTDPTRVHGFISRIAAERQLLERERGTFLLRFSESQPGELVVSFTEHVTQAAPRASSMLASAPRSRPRPQSMCVKHCLVEVRRGGWCYIEVEQGSKVPYPSLHDLVLACSSMQVLYPDVRKEDAFDEPSGGGPWGGGGGEGDAALSDTMSLYPQPPDVTRLSGPVGVVTLEEWGSRPIDMVLVDDDLDADLTLAGAV